MLRDRLACSFRDETLQRRLLAEKCLCFTVALSLAQAYEAARRDVQSMCNHCSADIPIDRMHVTDSSKASRSSNTKAPALHVGSIFADARHDRTQCSFKNARCSYCHRAGHVQWACYKKQSEHGNRPRESTGKDIVRGRIYCRTNVSRQAPTKNRRRVRHFCQSSYCDRRLPFTRAGRGFCCFGWGQVLYKA
ncbi:hypothetical protein TTRE_0000907101 [Trichuris trichiura]|uniref:Uncharacterized protein n=1 Tax=Trichuris trichiura TaxID=36087 RepID=A0A077ZPL7_TRITR|nr:hypothetical protein TTRE_0000907101 [Trichuris trichiura]